MLLQQLLPFAAEASVEQLQTNLQAMTDSPTTMIRSGMDAKAMLEKLLDGLEPQFSELRRPVGLAASCPCSEERVLRTLSLLPKEELLQICESNDVVEAKCEFCGTRYRKSADDVRAELAAREAKEAGGDAK